MADISKIKFNNVTYSVKDQTARDKMITESITYDNLVFYKATYRLIPGKYYRITDYVTTTALSDTQSAGHAFDIIVRADDVNKLNENAYAALHSGDTYFANSKLEAWELKYCLENDTTRFAWADSTNGKGVIYYMKDEFYNECGYDFKNILFKRYKTTKAGAFYNNMYFGATNAMGDELPYDATLNKNDYKYLYTFTTYTSNYAEIKDASLNTSYFNCYRNVIPVLYDEAGDYSGVEGFAPNNIVFQGQVGRFYYNSFGAGCCYSTIGDIFCINTIGNNFTLNTLGSSYWGNNIGNCCWTNIIGNNFKNNTIGNDLFNNTIGNNCYQNTIGNCCWTNTIGNYFDNNTIGNGFESNTIGNNFNNNTIGNDCNNFTIGKDYVRYIEIEDGNKNFTLTSTQTTSQSNWLQNICISRGVNNENSNPKIISHNSVGDTFKTTYQPANSQIINV